MIKLLPPATMDQATCVDSLTFLVSVLSSTGSNNHNRIKILNHNTIVASQHSDHAFAVLKAQSIKIILELLCGTMICVTDYSPACCGGYRCVVSLFRYSLSAICSCILREFSIFAINLTFIKMLQLYAILNFERMSLLDFYVGRLLYCVNGIFLCQAFKPH